MGELRECPFCGEDELPPLMPADPFGVVECAGCGATSPQRGHAGQRADPAERWNTRHPIDASATDGALEESLSIIEGGARRLVNQGEDLIWRTGEMIALHVEKIRDALKSTNSPAEPLKVAAQALLAKLDEALPKIQSAITIATMHHCPYDGPTIDDEIEALRAAL